MTFNAAGLSLTSLMVEPATRTAGAEQNNLSVEADSRPSFQDAYDSVQQSRRADDTARVDRSRSRPEPTRARTEKVARPGKDDSSAPVRRDDSGRDEVIKKDSKDSSTDSASTTAKTSDDKTCKSTVDSVDNKTQDVRSSETKTTTSEATANAAVEDTKETAASLLDQALANSTVSDATKDKCTEVTADEKSADALKNLEGKSKLLSDAKKSTQSPDVKQSVTLVGDDLKSNLLSTKKLLGKATDKLDASDKADADSASSTNDTASVNPLVDTTLPGVLTAAITTPASTADQPTVQLSTEASIEATEFDAKSATNKNGHANFLFDVKDEKNAQLTDAASNGKNSLAELKGAAGDSKLFSSENLLGKDLAAQSSTAQSSSTQSSTSQTDIPKATQQFAGLSALTAEPTQAAARGFTVKTSVDLPAGQPQWSQAVGEKVLWLAAQNVSSAELQLHPQDLGPLHVKVTIGQDQVTQVNFTSHHPQVRELLDQNMQRLKDMFAEQGMNSVNVDVSDRSFQRESQKFSSQSTGTNSNQLNHEDDEQIVAASSIQSIRLVDHYA